MRLLLYDDERLFGEALSSLLTHRGHEVPSVAPSEFVHAMQDTNHDACLANIHAPARHAGELIQQIKLKAPWLPVVALSSDSDPGLLQEAVNAGADGVCVKLDGIEEIESVLMRAASTREGLRSEPVWSRGATSLARRGSRGPRGAALTARERSVLELLIEGASTASIAEELGIGEATARTHLQHLFNKFGVHSRLALVASAVRSDAVRVPQQPFGSSKS